jgi:TatD DNase family protein
MIIEENKISEAELIKSLRYNNVEYSVQISVEADDFTWSRDFSKRNHESGVFYTLGIHPSSMADNPLLERLSSFVEQEMKGKYSHLLLGIGECGLDFYRMRQKKELQINSFETQIDIAKKFKLPLIIHTRDAMDETLSILKNKKYGYGIMHCFSGDSSAAKRVLDMGYYISFAGNVTYKNAVELHDAAAYVPPDRLMLETDSPFLSPIPLRGRSNLPENVKHTYKYISALKKISMTKLEDAVTENFKTLIKK